jgi:hypothetical protein
MQSSEHTVWVPLHVVEEHDEDAPFADGADGADGGVDPGSPTPRQRSIARNWLQQS